MIKRSKTEVTAQSPECRDWGSWKEDKFGQKTLVLGVGKKTHSWIIHIRGGSAGDNKNHQNVLKNTKQKRDKVVFLLLGLK